jgi:hypothetical protein
VNGTRKQTKEIKQINLLAFKIITIFHNTLLATFKKLLETISKASLGNYRRTAVTLSWFAATSENVRLS